jgi:hypothetical protein
LRSLSAYKEMREGGREGGREGEREREFYTSIYTSRLLQEYY